MPTASRSYDSPRRRAAAAKTRRRIVDTAGRMFSDNGYAGTSIKAVAAAADTSPENIYLVFGTKAALLSAWIDVSVAGDDAPVPFIDRAELQALADLSTFNERLATAMAINRAVNERVAAPLAVLDAASQSDPGIAALSTRLDTGRHQDIAQLLDVVLGDVPTRGDLDRGAVVDLVAALLSVHLYRALVLAAGWTTQQYEQELGRQISHSILPDHRLDTEPTSTSPRFTGSEEEARSTSHR